MERKRPVSILAITILGLCLGMLGACAGTAGILGQLGQDALQDQQRALLSGSGQNQEQVEANIRMQEAMREALEPYTPALIAQATLNLLASLGLLAASVLLLMWKPIAPATFMLTVAANAFVDIGGAVLQAIVQRHSMAAMQAGLAEVTAAGPQPPGMDQMMEGIAGATTMATMCIGGLWILLKLAYYGSGVMVLRKDENRALFAPAGPNSAP